MHDTGETGHLAVLDGGEAIYIERVEARRALRVPSAIGRGYPAHATNLGKVLLADLPRERVVEIVAERGLASYTPQHHHRPRRARVRARADPAARLRRSTTRSTTRACAASGRRCATTPATSWPRSASAGRSPGSPPSASRSWRALVMTAATRPLAPFRRPPVRGLRLCDPACAHDRARRAAPAAGPRMSIRPPPGRGAHAPTPCHHHPRRSPTTMATTARTPLCAFQPHLPFRPAQAVGVHAQGRGARARDRQARHPLREGRLPGR